MGDGRPHGGPSEDCGAGAGRGRWGPLRRWAETSGCEARLTGRRGGSKSGRLMEQGSVPKTLSELEKERPPEVQGGEG